MIKNYFKIAWRNLIKNKAFTIINVLGLTLGITTCLIVYLITGFELSYDTFHPDKERIYRAVSTFQKSSGDKNYNTAVPEPMAAAIRNDFTGVEKVVQFHNYYAKVNIRNGHSESKNFDIAREGEEPSEIIITDPEYFDIFKYQWLAGSAASMKEPLQVVLAESKAIKYFGPIPLNTIIGREIIYNDSLRLSVSGIVKDYPENSNFIFKDFISSATINYSFLKSEFRFNNWRGWSGYSQTFVKLSKGESLARFEKQAAVLVKKNMEIGHGVKVYIGLQPLSDIHFNTSFEAAYGRQVHLPTLYGLMGIALFILLIASINFINLSTAQSLQRAKEIGIRKVLGSKRAGLVLQFLSETFILTLFAVILSLLVTPPLIAAFRTFIPNGVTLNFNPQTLIFLLLVTLITSLLAGLYPAKVLSSYRPVVTLKGTGLQTGGGKNYLRRGLIVFQFAISLVFIICTIVIGNQIHYVLNADMGFTKDAIINIPTGRDYAKDKEEILAQQVKQVQGVQMVSVDMGTPAEKDHWGTVIKCRAVSDDEVESQFQTGDENYIRLYNLALVAGRNLLPSDTMKEVLINETCAKKLGFKKPADAIGQLLEAGMSDGADNKQLPIVGVLADFHSQSLHDPISPTFMSTSKEFSSVVTVKLSTQGKQVSNLKQTLAKIEGLWKDIYPNEKFEYKFFDKTIATFYDKEQKTAQLMNTAMAIAIFISCMGLFGLATFAAQQRTKEIGIRKVLGASVTGIVSMLSRDFVKLVFIAIVIASPVAYLFMRPWLQDFAYRINISWWIFVISGLSAVLIALVTVSFQAIKAAIANPVKSLRTE